MCQICFYLIITPYELSYSQNLFLGYSLAKQGDLNVASMNVV